MSLSLSVSGAKVSNHNLKHVQIGIFKTFSKEFRVVRIEVAIWKFQLQLATLSNITPVSSPPFLGRPARLPTSGTCSYDRHGFVPQRTKDGIHLVNLRQNTHRCELSRFKEINKQVEQALPNRSLLTGCAYAWCCDEFAVRKLVFLCRCIRLRQ